MFQEELNVVHPGPTPTPPADWRAGWLSAYDCEMPSTVPYPRAPLTVLLEHAARRFPDRAACVLYGQPTSYARLDDRARRLARALQALGVGKGDHVGLLLPNIPEYLAAMQAVWLCGAAALQISPLFVAEEVNHWLKATGCRVVITLDLLAPLVTGSLAPHGPLEHVVLTSLASRVGLWKGLLYRVERMRRNGFLSLPEDAHRHSFDHLVNTHEPLDRAVDVNPAEDVAVLAPTGGTTSSPKAVQLTHRNLLANALQVRAWAGGPDGAEGVLGVLPFFHCYGLTGAVLCCWARGSTLHLLPKFEARPVLELLLQARPEYVLAVPAMLNVLNALMRGKKTDLSFVRTAISGASALSEPVRQEFLSHGVGELAEGYGLTEASPVTHVSPRGGVRAGSIGRPLADTEARVVNPDTGLEVGVGEVGELAVRGPQVMKGYYRNPEATAAVLRDGWLFTGDIARRDGDGYFYIVDRKRDIIKTSGYLVYPAEVEEVLRSFDGVADAAVVGVPDEERGEAVKALVVARGGKAVDVPALEGFCRQHLGKHKRPRSIEIVDELPRNFLGKVLRRKLREETVGNHAATHN